MKPNLSSLIDNYIESFIFTFETTYDSSHEVVDDVIIFHYGQEFIRSPFEVIPYHSIVFSLNRSPEETHHIIARYPFKGDGSYAIFEFHEEMNPEKHKIRYKQLGYEYFLPNILQMTTLPAEIDSIDVEIHPVTSLEDADRINLTFNKLKPFPTKLVRKDDISAIYTVVDQKVVGWSQLVRHSGKTAYLAGMYSLPEYRRQGIAAAMLNKIHHMAYADGIKRILLVPSLMAWKFYTQRGYETIIHFSTFMPSIYSNPKSNNN